MDYDISVSEGITLVVLDEAPSDLCFVSSVFEALASENINIDMISQSPPKGCSASLSFTLSDQNLGKALEVVYKIREAFPQTKISVSSGNTKLLISGSKMKDTYGVAAIVLKTAAKSNLDIRMITTSEVDISLLITQSDLSTMFDLLNQNL